MITRNPVQYCYMMIAGNTYSYAPDAIKPCLLCRTYSAKFVSRLQGEKYAVRLIGSALVGAERLAT